VISPAELGTMVIVTTVTSIVISWLLATAATLVHHEATAYNAPAWTMIPYDFLSELSRLMDLPAYILAGLWPLRVRRNANLITPGRQRWADIWIWVGWLLPLFNFWVPWQSVADVWRSTVPGLDKSRIDRWWSAWILLGMLEFVTYVVNDDSRVGVVAVIFYWMDAAAVTVAAILWTRIVQIISDAQDGLASDIMKARIPIRNARTKTFVVAIAPTIALAVSVLAISYNIRGGGRDVTDANIGECLGGDAAENLAIVPCNSTSARWTVVGRGTTYWGTTDESQRDCEFTGAEKILTKTDPRGTIGTALCLKSAPG
jgi:hypothetical protein